MIAIGTLYELETQYLISIRLKFVEKNSELEKVMIESKTLLSGFRNYIENKK